MIVTDRDLRLVKDVALSHVLSRDQILGLSYFASVSRANRRLRGLCDTDLLRPLSIPFEHQRLYVAGPKADCVVGERIAALLATRAHSPRFLQHALMTTNVRICLQRQNPGDWRFEQQIRDTFTWAGRQWELRPDGLFAAKRCIEFVEVDLGHVSLPKFSRKLRGYAGYVASGRFESVYGMAEPKVLVVTTGKLRQRHLAKGKPYARPVVVEFCTFEGLGIDQIGGWS